VGKTTTARIIARALNCTGPDGQGGPTISPCGVCDNCKAISEDRHPDVFEMDAASRTGIGDIREIIEAVRYAPSMARYKVYIIDEVHMLSTAAFNGLLKTLEEPPAHVKFVFATTEIRKVPVTVLSRCQRFDLKRVEISVLAAHFKRIAEQENAQIDDDALTLIARAAEGSVRDGLSLLDQAIAHGAGKADAELVRDMLGLADRGQVFALLDALLHGRLPEALENLQQQYNLGADPAVVIQDLLELTHWLTRVKVIGGTPDDVTLPETQRNRGRELAGKLGMPVLARSWQMLLKGLQEVRAAPVPLAAAEMVLVRLAYAADLPSPADLAKEWREKGGPGVTPPSRPAPSGGNGGGTSAALATQPVMQAAPQVRPGETVALAPMPATFPAVVQLAREMREMSLSSELYNDVHVVSFERGRIEMRLNEGARHDLPGRLTEKLKAWTGERWVVSLSKLPGEPTLAEQEQAEESRRRAHVQAHPLVQAVLNAFPGAVLEQVREAAPPAMVVEEPAEEPGYVTDDVDPLDELD
jgi:DNA polymerase-3 subunit gamma/tau